MSRRYIAFDTETGGFGLDKSLLEFAAVILDEELRQLDSLHLLLMPDDGNFVINKESLKVTQLNLIEHVAKAITYKEAKSILFSWLKNHEKGWLIPIGKSYKTDIDQICDKIISRANWDIFVSHLGIDLDTVLRYEELRTGVSPESFALQSDKQGKHTALEDVELTIKLLKKYLNDRPLVQISRPSDFIHPFGPGHPRMGL
jgi:DNA polymerase III epsilon subunit-like protein